MNIEALLNYMPPYKGNGVFVVKGDQSTRDLIKEVKAAHKFFANDYDRVAALFAGKSPSRICRELFNLCKECLPYNPEDKDWQTSRSPGAILTIAKNGGTCDCKHYAAFVAGVLDSLNRNYGYRIDWVYRFASYKWWDETPEHVYVVVDSGDYETWIDPAPLDNWMGYIERDFDDRYVEPSSFKDKKVKSMSIVRLSGIGRLPYDVGEQDPLSYDKLMYDDAGGGGGGSTAPTVFYPTRYVSDQEPGFIYQDEPMAPPATAEQPVYYLDPVNVTVSPVTSADLQETAPDIITTGVPVTATVEPDEPAPKDNTLLYVAAAGVLLFLLTRKKKRK